MTVARRWILAALDAMFASLRVWRRLRGGHWEQWFIDSPVNGDVWMPVDPCSASSGYRPPLGRGTPNCETYR